MATTGNLKKNRSRARSVRTAPHYYRNFRLSHHGTRGLLSAGLAGEAVAALAC